MATPAQPTTPGVAKTNSKTVTDTIVGEHTHTIVGYSLIKGIGDGEPIASERFTVGGHEWVLLFYPDGKRSSSSDIQAPLPAAPQAAAPAPAEPQQAVPLAGAPAPPANIAPEAARAVVAALGAAVAAHADAPGHQEQDQPAEAHRQPAAGAAAAPPNVPAAGGANHAVVHHHHHHHQGAAAFAPAAPVQRPQRRDTTGVVNTSDGKVVRAFHRFTLVDQSEEARHLTKGRMREAGAVKISCARQDPNARNCHGYRKFVKRNILEDNHRGFLLNDTIVIKYTIELVVSTGGALSRSMQPSKTELVKVPSPSLGRDLAELLSTGSGDFTMVVEDEEIKVHRMIFQARSPWFKRMIQSGMREFAEGTATIKEMHAPVFRALLHFVYSDTLPEDLEGDNFGTAMAQHLLVAADRFELERLRRICERRLCETVDVETVATTLTLAEQNNAEELKRVCLEFVSKNLQAVMVSKGFKHLKESCPELQTDILTAVATASPPHERPPHSHTYAPRPPHYVRIRDHNEEAERRVRQRRHDANQQ